MPSVQIHLNTEDCIKYYSGSSYCEFSLPMYTVPSTSTLYISVVHATIPYSFYNINSSNNTLCYSVSNNNIQRIYLTQGNYTTTSLLAQLINLLPNTFTITYNQQQNTFTFTNSYTFTFYYNVSIGFSTCFGLLGFSNSQQTSTVNGASQILTSNVIINLAPVRCLCIYTTLHTGSLATISPNNQNILCSIPVSTAPFTMICQDNTSNYKIDLNTNVFNAITLKLTDQEGNLISLNGLHWSLTLQLDIVDYTLDL